MRISERLKADQEPRDRLWGAIIVLAVIAIIVGCIAFEAYQSSEAGNKALSDAQSVGFQRGAVDCLTVVVDNDRTFDIPDYCRRVEVIQWYPPQVCAAYFADAAYGTCGGKWGTG